MTSYFHRDLESSSVFCIPEFGFEAQKRNPNGRPAGERYTALTLDELAALLANADAGT